MSVPQQQSEVTRWAVVLHLSVFAAYIVPVAGLIVPVLIWMTQKETRPDLDAHGRVVVNGVLSFVAYVAICIPLVGLLIGIPLLVIVAVLAIVFPIIGAFKASRGQLWKYPLTIPFFRVE